MTGLLVDNVGHAISTIDVINAVLGVIHSWVIMPPKNSNSVTLNLYLVALNVSPA